MEWLWYPGFRPCWCPSPFPSPSISRFFLFTLLHLPLDFIRLFFTVTVSAPHHQPSSSFQTWDWHYGNWISEQVEIPWWWNCTVLKLTLTCLTFYYVVIVLHIIILLFASFN